MLFFFLNRNIILTLLALAAVALIPVIVRAYKKKKANRILEDLKPSLKKDLLIGLRDNAEAFNELYEPLFVVASGNTGRKEWVFDSWLEIVKSLDQEAFRIAFFKKFATLASKPVTTKKAKKAKKIDKKLSKKAKKAAKALVKYLKKAGILRDCTKTVTADETTAEKYDVIGTTSLEPDAKYDVFVPYWTLTTRVREKVEAEEAAAPAEEAAPVEAAEAPVAAEEKAEAEVEVTENTEFVEAAPVEAAPEKPAKPTKKEKKAEKKTAKKAKKASKKEKKAEKKEQFVIIENTILLSKGAIR